MDDVISIHSKPIDHPALPLALVGLRGGGTGGQEAIQGQTWMIETENGSRRLLRPRRERGRMRATGKSPPLPLELWRLV